MLSGKYTRDTEFPEDVHRNYNRDRAAFDVGTGLATGALDICDRYFREAIHPRW